MKGTAFRLGVVLVAAAVLLPAAPLLAGRDGERRFQWGSPEDDLYMAGGRVTISANVKGDVVAAGGKVVVVGDVGANAIVAGGEVEIIGAVAGDVLVVGGEVTIRGTVGDDVRAAGGSVTVEAVIAGDLLAAGGQIRLDPGAAVEGNAKLAGGELDLRGSIGKNLEAAGGEILISGSVGGDVILKGGHIEIGPTARIEGNLTYESRSEATIDPQARIGGQVEFIQTEPLRRGIWIGVGFVVLAVLAIFATALVLYALFPDFGSDAARTLLTNPWRSLFLGFALVFSLPAAGIFLTVTVIGIPLGVLILVLYPLVLVLAFLTTALYLAKLVAALVTRRPEPAIGWQVVFLLVALVVLFAVGSLPWLGGIVMFLAVVFGLGALARQTWEVYHAPGRSGF